MVAEVKTTLADGLAVPMVGAHAFEVARHWVDEVVEVIHSHTSLVCVCDLVFFYTPLLHTKYLTNSAHTTNYKRADGLAVPMVGAHAFEVARHWVDEVVEVLMIRLLILTSSL